MGVLSDLRPDADRPRVYRGASITLHTAYAYPNEFTEVDKNDAKKVIEDLNHRLAELGGIVIFDEAQHYRIDLDAGWKNWDDVKKLKDKCALRRSVKGFRTSPVIRSHAVAQQ